jgi:hypothetical protein
MFATCFEPEGSNSGRRLYMQLWYGVTKHAPYRTVCCRGWIVPIQPGQQTTIYKE